MVRSRTISRPRRAAFRTRYAPFLLTAIALGSMSREALAAFPVPSCTKTCNTYGDRAILTPTIAWRSNLLPHDEHNFSNYANNLDHWKVVTGSKYIQKVSMHFSSFNTVYPNDYFEYFQEGNGSYHGNASGSYSPFWTEIPQALISGDTTYQYARGWFHFKTDATNTSTGWFMDQMAVCCTDYSTTHTTPQYTMYPGIVQTGIAVATNDVVNFAISPSTDKNITITTWPASSAADDHAVYVACGTLPDANNFLYQASTGSSAFRFIRIPPTTLCQSTWYVSVVARSGPQVFNIMHATMFANHWQSIDVHFERYPTTDELNNAIDVLTTGTRALFGLTEGQRMMYRYELYLNNPCGLPNYTTPVICLWHSPGQDSAYLGGQIDLHLNSDNNTHWGGYPLAHEYGHSLFHLQDEYVNNQAGCGHSFMDGSGPAINANVYNYCYDERPYGGTGYDHARDPFNAGQATSVNEDWGPMWNNGHVPTRMQLTPDNNNFSTHPLGGYPTFGYHY
jgi:hypothetical protein